MRFRVSSITSCDFIWKSVSMSMEAKKFIVVESFTEADWQGSQQAKPTSASCHFMNGNTVRASSRSQHVIPLSWTESSFTRRLLEHLTGSVSNMSCSFFWIRRQIQPQLQTAAPPSRLHKSLEHHVCAIFMAVRCVASVKGQSFISEDVPSWNSLESSRNGYKNFCRHGQNMLLFMLGVVDDGVVVGEEEFLRQKQAEYTKPSIRIIKSLFVLPKRQVHLRVFVKVSGWLCVMQHWTWAR